MTRRWAGASDDFRLALIALGVLVVLFAFAVLSGDRELWNDQTRSKWSVVLLSVGGLLTVAPLVEKLLPNARPVAVTVAAPLVGLVVFFKLGWIKHEVWRVAVAGAVADLLFLVGTRLLGLWKPLDARTPASEEALTRVMLLGCGLMAIGTVFGLYP